MTMLTLKQAAKIINVSPATLRVWWWQHPKAGQPPLQKSGRRWVVAEDQLLAWNKKRLQVDGRSNNKLPGQLRKGIVDLARLVKSQDEKIAQLKAQNQRLQATVEQLQSTPYLPGFEGISAVEGQGDIWQMDKGREYFTKGDGLSIKEGELVINDRKAGHIEIEALTIDINGHSYRIKL